MTQIWASQKYNQRLNIQNALNGDQWQMRHVLR